jgi:hypothetical protein
MDQISGRIATIPSAGQFGRSGRASAVRTLEFMVCLCKLFHFAYHYLLVYGSIAQYRDYKL